MSEQLKSRTKRFALDVIALCASYPKRPETRHVFAQVLRSSSSVAANYHAACRARSALEFLSKLGIVEEECDETQFWLEMLRDSAVRLKLAVPIRSQTDLERLIREAEEVLRITVAAKKTMRAKIAKGQSREQDRSASQGRRRGIKRRWIPQSRYGRERDAGSASANYLWVTL